MKRKKPKIMDVESIYIPGDKISLELSKLKDFLYMLGKGTVYRKKETLYCYDPDIVVIYVLKKGEKI